MIELFLLLDLDLGTQPLYLFVSVSRFCHLVLNLRLVSIKLLTRHRLPLVTRQKHPRQKRPDKNAPTNAHRQMAYGVQQLCIWYVDSIIGWFFIIINHKQYVSKPAVHSSLISAFSRQCSLFSDYDKTCKQHRTGSGSSCSPATKKGRTGTRVATLPQKQKKSSSRSIPQSEIDYFRKNGR